MAIEIFSIELPNIYGERKNLPNLRDSLSTEFQKLINQVLSAKSQLNPTVTWLQSSAASTQGSFTMLTAIITY